MDYAHILALIAALGAPPADPPGFPHLAGGGPDPDTPVRLHDCVQPIGYDEIEGQTVICGAISVPEDHAAPQGRRIELEFAVLKSRSSYPDPDPLIHLHGGPGGGVVDQIAGYAQVFGPWRQTRDVILFDQRSSGLSATSVACYRALSSDAASVLDLPGQAADSQLTAIVDCIAELRADGVDLAAYNTLQNAYDVRSIATGLGYETYNLYGISYGTRLALEVMRSAPEGLRAVIIDGVDPPSVRAYDTVAVPADEAMDILASQCAADPACNTAYPDLRAITRDLLDKAVAGDLVIDGNPVPAAAVIQPLVARNGQYRSASLTPYIPAYIYEIHRGGDTPTIDMLSAKGFNLPLPGEAEATAAAATLPADQRKLAERAVADLATQLKAMGDLQQTVWDLFAASRASDYGPIVQLFDSELSEATRTLLLADRDQALALGTAMIVDYLALEEVPPSREALQGFVEKHFAGDALSRLSALISAMRQSEIDGSFALIASDSHTATAEFLQGQHLAFYACQEDLPFNSIDGYDALTPTLHFPGLGAVFRSAALSLFSICGTLPPQPREGFHLPVTSDIPTLSIGSMWDTQTAPSWAALAVETLANGQTKLIPEAGHGALLYQHCVSDMGVAFINDPMRQLDDSCPQSIEVEFYIAPWATPGATASTGG